MRFGLVKGSSVEISSFAGEERNGTLRIRGLTWASLLLLIFIAGCTSQKATSQTDTFPAIIPAVEKKEEQVIEENQPVEDLPIVPDTFDIGLTLPFYLDSVRALPDSVDVSYYDKSTLAIEFYNGVRIALRQFADSGLHARLHVFDDMNDRERAKRIAQLADFKKLDVMLGPVFNNNLRVMAEYAKQDSVLLVSPLSPAMNITTRNPFYIMLNSGIEVHCRKLFDYVVQNNYGQHIVLFTRPGSPVEEQYVTLFRNMLKQYQAETGDTSFRFTEISFTPKDEGDDLATIDAAFTKYFDPERANLVIVPSVDKAYNHSVARKLYSLTEPPKEIKDAQRFDITLFGLPTWGDQDGLRLDYAQRLRVHFTSSSFIPPRFYSPENFFYKAYLDSFQTEPSEYAVKGYDLLMFFGSHFLKYGAHADSMLLAENFKGIHTRFQFGVHAVESASGAFSDVPLPIPVADFIENKYVHLLRYEGNEVKEVE